MVIHTSTVDLLVTSPGVLCTEVMVGMEDTPEMTEVTEDHLHLAEITMVEVMEDTEDDLEEEEDRQEGRHQEDCRVRQDLCHRQEGLVVGFVDHLG